MSFAARAQTYRNRFLFGSFFAEAVRWLPGGVVMAVFAFLFSIRGGFSPWLSLPVLMVPTLTAGLLVVLRHRDVASALSWLDRKREGRQELQAAWEHRESAGPLSEAIAGTGERLLPVGRSRPPIPAAGPVSSLAALVSVFVWLILMVAGAGLFFEPDRETAIRGNELEAFAEAWAEEMPEDAESRDMAERMSRLGRRMASGELGAGRAERALREMEEEIEERQEDLKRDTLAESLVDDLELDRKSAEAFRVGKKRMPADVLSELGDAVAGSTILSSEEREMLERLLSDPSMRDENGRGRPELTENLTDALDRALNDDDPLRKQLERAEEETARARITDRADNKEGAEGDRSEALENAQPAPAGEASSGGAARSSDDTEVGTGSSGGSGRGDSAVTDDSAGELPPVATDSEENPLRLPSPSGGEDSWKTVIRAYGEAGDTTDSGDVGSLPTWDTDVESVIGRDDIPPGVRDYVREYFLALEEGPDIPNTGGDAENEPDNQHSGTTREE